jgi:hypothetical protein
VIEGELFSVRYFDKADIYPWGQMKKVNVISDCEDLLVLGAAAGEAEILSCWVLL